MITNITGIINIREKPVLSLHRIRVSFTIVARSLYIGFIFLPC